MTLCNALFVCLFTSSCGSRGALRVSSLHLQPSVRRHYEFFRRQKGLERLQTPFTPHRQWHKQSSLLFKQCVHFFQIRLAYSCPQYCSQTGRNYRCSGIVKRDQWRWGQAASMTNAAFAYSTDHHLVMADVGGWPRKVPKTIHNRRRSFAVLGSTGWNEGAVSGSCIDTLSRALPGHKCFLRK